MLKIYAEILDWIGYWSPIGDVINTFYGSIATLRCIKALWWAVAGHVTAFDSKKIYDMSSRTGSKRSANLATAPITVKYLFSNFWQKSVNWPFWASYSLMNHFLHFNAEFLSLFFFAKYWKKCFVLRWQTIWLNVAVPSRQCSFEAEKCILKRFDTIFSRQLINYLGT